MSARLAPPGRHDGSLGITDEEFSHNHAGVLARLRAQGDLDFGPAVLDPAHIGDIQGSLGTISLRDRAPRRTWRRRLVTFAAIAGPGIIVICVAAFALNSTRHYGPAASYIDSGWFNNAIGATLGSTAGAMAAVMLLVAAVLGAGAVSLSTSYAFGDSLGRKHSLHRTMRSAPVFYLAYGAQIAAASLVVLLASGSVLGTLTQWVQVLAGILLPSAILFLVLLCNDKQILGPWVNKTWQNAVDFTIIGVLVVLSMILVVSTLFTSVNGVALIEGLFAASAGAVLVIGTPLLLRSRRRFAAGGSADRLADVRHLDRATWRMPPLDHLSRPVLSPLRTAGLLLLRGYLIASVLLITIKIFSSFIH